VVFALSCLLLAKLTNVAVPMVFKDIIDSFTLPGSKLEQAVLLVPLGLLAAYGALRFSTVLFTELREIFFARVTQRAVRTITLQVFEHLHSLSCASTSTARPAASRATSSAARARSAR
jgi:ABC-type multidrug transport system fused ATPase/permease subunit